MQQENLISYIKGLATEEERQAVEAWLKEKPDNEMIFRQLKALLEKIEVGEKVEAPNIDIAWKRVRSKIQPERRSRRRFFYQLSGIAASMLILVSIYLGWSNWAAEEWITLERDGQVELQMFTLPDGSQVWLKENTKLRYSSNFGEENREVELTGEAFFEVKKDSIHPFTIQAGETVTKVLGTSFNVMAYPDSTRKWVQVNTGKVAFFQNGREDKKVVLDPGQRGVFDLSTMKVSKIEQGEANDMAWRTGKLLFDEMQLEEAVQLLSDLYHKNIRLCPEELGVQKINASFDGEDLEEILESISISLELQQTNSLNNEIRLVGADCPK
ncbi:MAG: FecR domain-containing protein [Bacteroidia bacterium]